MHYESIMNLFTCETIQIMPLDITCDIMLNVYKSITAVSSIPLKAIVGVAILQAPTSMQVRYPRLNL